MKCLVVTFLMTVISFACFAQDSAEYRACSDKANTQSEMTACASDEAARVDAKLKTTYRALLARVTSQPEALAKIKAAERAWIAYRDAYIEASYPQKTKPPNTDPSILSTSISFEPSSRGARSPPSKTCFCITHPNRIPESHAAKFNSLGD